MNQNWFYSILVKRRNILLHINHMKINHLTLNPPKIQEISMEAWYHQFKEAIYPSAVFDWKQYRKQFDRTGPSCLHNDSDHPRAPTANPSHSFLHTPKTLLPSPSQPSLQHLRAFHPSPSLLCHLTNFWSSSPESQGGEKAQEDTSQRRYPLYWR